MQAELEATAAEAAARIRAMDPDPASLLHQPHTTLPLLHNTLFTTQKVSLLHKNVSNFRKIFHI